MSMPKADPAEHKHELLERKLTQVNATISATSTMVSVLIFTLAVAWLLSLEPQITPLFLKANKPKKALEKYEKEGRALEDKQKAMESTAKKRQEVAAELKKIDDRSGAFPEGQVRKLKEMERSYESQVKDQQNENRSKRVELTNEIRRTAEDISKQKAQAESVNFKLPLLDIKIPRIAGPLGWCVVAFGTVLFVGRVRRRVHRLVAEAVSLSDELSIPKTHLNDLLEEEPWWLQPFPKEALCGWPLARLSVAIWAFWGLLTIACLRMICLGLHALAFEDQGWMPQTFLVVSTGLTAVTIYLLIDWSRSAPSPPPTPTCSQRPVTRRKMLLGVGSCGLGILIGLITLRFFRPTTLSSLASSIELLRQPNGSPRYHSRRKAHTSMPPPLPPVNESGKEVGVFLLNQKNCTVHYIFPRDAYGVNAPKTFRPQGPSTSRSNPAPRGSFVRWGKAPRAWGEVVLHPETLLSTDEKPAAVPHVALIAAASSFEHAMLNGPVKDGNLPKAIEIGLAGIRHDLRRGEKPNLRIYDLTAGLMVRVGDRAGLTSLVQLISKANGKNAFGRRLVKWADPDNKWARRWHKDNVITWATQEISSLLLK